MSGTKATPNTPTPMRIPGAGASIQLPPAHAGAQPTTLHYPIEGGTFHFSDGRSFTYTPFGAQSSLPRHSQPVALAEEDVARAYGVYESECSTWAAETDVDSLMTDVPDSVMADVGDMEDFDGGTTTNVETHTATAPEMQRVLRWRAGVEGDGGSFDAAFPVFGEEGTATEDGMTAFGSLRTDDDGPAADAECEFGDEDMADAEDRSDSSSGAATVFAPPRKCKVIVPAAAQRQAKTKALATSKQAVSAVSDDGQYHDFNSDDESEGFSESKRDSEDDRSEFQPVSDDEEAETERDTDTDSDDSEGYHPDLEDEEDGKRSEYQSAEDDDAADAEMGVKHRKKKGAKNLRRRRGAGSTPARRTPKSTPTRCSRG
jgi:hypothetical protein